MPDAYRAVVGGPPDEHPGRALRRLRESAGLSLGRLADEVHYSKSQLSKIETGRAPLPAGLAGLCDTVLDTGGLLRAMVAAGPAPARRAPTLRSGLPPAAAGFVGRQQELSRIQSFLTRPTASEDPGVSRVCVVHGMAGVGKTALAVRAAYQVASAYPDGCLFLDLHGYTSGIEPVSPATALDRCLRLLDVPAEAIPPDLDDRSAVFRDRLQDRRLLLVLDNAADSAQLRPLLPAVPTCPVVVTSRRRMPAFDDAEHVELEPLGPDEAGTLFRSVAGRELVEQEAAQVVGRVVRRCGLLPLAVRIAAARLRLDGAATLADLEHLLSDDRSYLAELDDGDRAAASAFDASFDHLSEPHRQMFTTVARHPGPDLTPASAAAMTGTPEPDARRRLDHLTAAHLVIRQPGGRYRMHDLVRAYAVAVGDSGPEPLVPLKGLLDHYLEVTLACDALIAPHRHRPASVPGGSAPRPGGPTSRPDAVAWLAAELDNLVAAVRAAVEAGLDRPAWQLAHALRGYFFLVKDWDRWIGTHRLALAAAARDGARDGEGFLLNGLGLALFERGDVDGAAAAYDRALQLFTESGDRFGISSTLGNRAWVHEQRGEHRAALLDQRAALRYYEQVGALHNVAVTQRGLAVAEIGLGAFADAVEHLDAALRTFDALGLPLDEAMALNCLGDARSGQGDPDAARAAYQAAADRARASGSRYEEARARRGLADTSDDPETARRHLVAALALYEPLDAPEAAQLRAALEVADP